MGELIEGSPKKGQSPSDAIDALMATRDKNAPDLSSRTPLSEIMATLNPDSIINWPGAIVSGQALIRGAAHTLKTSRAPITITNSVTKKSQTVSDPTNSSVASALREISDFSDNPTVTTSVTFSSGHYLQQIDAALQASGDTFTYKFGGNASLSGENEETLVVTKVEQKFFSVSMDTIRKASDFFSASETAEALAKIIQEDDFPVVVRSVGYGRALYVVSRTSASATDFQAAIRAAYSTVGGGGKGSITAAQKTMINAASTMAISFGLGAKSTAETIADVDDLKRALSTFLSSTASAVPIDITTALLTHSMKPVKIPVGLLSVKLTKVEALSGNGEDPPNGNYKVFGKLKLTYVDEKGSDKATLWELSDLTSDPSSASDYWVKLENADSVATIKSGIDKTCRLSYNGGELTMYSDLWDYFHGSPNEHLGDNSVTASAASIFGQLDDFPQNGQQTITFSTECKSKKWGDVIINFYFDVSFLN